MPGDTNQSSSQSSSGRGHSRALEWVVAAASALLVGWMMAYLAYEALDGRDRPPDLTVMVEGIDRTEAGVTIKVALANRGDLPAAEVLLIATSPLPSGTMEKREMIFDYVPAGSARRAAVIFPATASEEVNWQVGGYRAP